MTNRKWFFLFTVFMLLSVTALTAFASPGSGSATPNSDGQYLQDIANRMLRGLPVTAQEKADVTPYLESQRGYVSPISSTDAVSAAPDGYGYTWIDNNAQVTPPGPTYTWIDISTTGTTGPTGDDVTSAMVPLGFTFPFYGMNFTSVTMSTDGWLSFNSAFASLSSSWYSQYSLPSASMPQSLIAVLYRDSYVTSATSYIKYQQYNSTTFIVQWNTDSGEQYEAILTSDGNIKLQYNVATANTGTIGLQNDARTIACQYQYSTACPVSGRAILFVPPCNTVTQVSPANGTIGVTTETQTLTWVGGSCTANYDLYCSTVQADVSSGAVAAQQLVGSTATSFIMPITAGNVYYWKVVAHGTSPATNTSPIWTFNTIAALTGTKTINPALPTGGDNYQTFAAAVTALYAAGAGTGGVTFNVSPGTYIEQVTLTGAYPGMGASSPVTFRAVGVGVNISPNVTTTLQYGVKLSGAQYVTFDGINIVDASTGTYPLYYGYWLNNSAGTLGARYNTIKNATIQMRINASYATYGVYQYYNTSPYPSSALGSQSYNRYLNLKISKVRYGVYCYSYSSYPDMGNEIGSEVSGFDNTNRFVIGSAVGDTIGGAGAAYGIYANYQNGLSIHDIDIKNLKTYTSSYTMYGMYLYYSPYSGGTASPLLIYNNRVYDFTALYTSGYTTMYGIYSYLYYSYGHQRIYNNMVYNLQQTYTGTVTASYYTYGIYCGYYYPTVVNNTIMLNQLGTQNFSSACLYYSSNYAANDTCKNNIFANLGSQTSTTPYHVGMYNPCTYPANWITSNNSYYIPNATGGYIGYNAAAYRATLSAFQTAYTPNVDLASTTGDPLFRNSATLPYDVRILENQGASVIENLGTPTFVTTDIEGQARSLTTPDIGADEGTFVTLVPTAPTVSYPANPSTSIPTNATLMWNASAGGSPMTYAVYYDDFTPPTTVRASGLSALNYTPSSELSPTTTYYWKVVAHNSYGDTPGGIWQFTTSAGVAPNAPTDAAPPISGVATTALTFNWVDNSLNETGFPIERSTDGTTFSALTTAAINATTYTNTGLTPSTRYWYRAYAIGTGGRSATWASGDSWTLASVPGAPTFGAAAFTTLQVTPANGSPANSAAATYAIHETTTNQFVQATGALGATAVWQPLATWGTVTVTGLLQATSYTFEVKARNGALIETVYGPTGTGTTGDPFHLGPDAYGYRLIANNGTGYNWITPSGTATTVSGWSATDDGSAGPYNIGFNFSFYGHTYTTWYAGSNGRIQFGGQNAYNYSSATFPLTGGYPAGVYFWNYDMSVASTTVVYENLTAPNRLVVTYTNFATLGGYGPIAAQVVVYEDGRVDVNYGPRNSTTQTYCAAAAIQDTNGTNGCLQYAPPTPDSLRTYHFFKLNAPTVPVPANTATGVPTNATLSWVGDANATGYDVYFGTSATPPLVSSNQTGLSYTPATLDTMTVYYWRVDSRMGSTVVTGTPWSFTSGRGVAPNAPTNGQILSATLNTLGGTFTDNSDNETGFIVQRSLDGTTFTNYATLSAHTGTGTVMLGDTGLTANTHYWYRVFSTNAAGTSTGYAAADGWTLSLPTMAFTTTSSATPLTSANFGIRVIGAPITVTYTVRNTGGTPLNIGSVVSSNTAVTTSWTSQTIAGGGTQNIDVIWAPTVGGALASTLTFNSDATNNPVVINVTGTAMAVHNLPITTDFSGTFPPSEWTIINPDASITWTQYTSPYSAHMNWWSYGTHGALDYLVTPIVSTVGVTSAGFDFDWSYYYYSSYNDSLMIKYTLDGGTNWTTIWKRWGHGTGTDSLPAGTGGASMTPATAGTWGHASIMLAGTGCLGQPQVQFALVSGNDYGADLYLTNLNIYNLDGAALSTSATSLSFAGAYGNCANTRSIVLTNTGTQPLHVTSMTASTVSLSHPSATIAVGATDTLVTTWTPTAGATLVDTLVIVSDALNGSPRKIPLSGASVTPFTALPVSANFGNVLVGGSKVLTIGLTNQSTCPQQISAVTSPATVTPEWGARLFPALGTANISFLWTPTVAGTLAGNDTLFADGGNLLVPATGTALNAFVDRQMNGVTPWFAPTGGLTTTPFTFTAGFYAASTMTVDSVVVILGASRYPMTLTGGTLPGELDYAVTTTIPTVGSTAYTITAYYQFGGAQTYTTSSITGPTVLPAHTGGPDAAGYCYRTSFADGGPTFGWVAHTASAVTQTTWTSVDDGNSGAVPIGFSFPFYGNNYTTMYLGTNGRIEFGGTYDYSYSQVTFPYASDSAAIMFWNRDMHVGYAPNTVVRYETFTDHCVITYDSLSIYGTNGASRLSAQIILYSTGRVVLQYRNYVGTLSLSSVGIQNGTGSTYLAYIQSGATIPAENSAIEFYQPAMLAANPTSVAYGSVTVGTTNNQTTYVKNVGRAALNITGVSAPAHVTPSWLTHTIAAGDSALLQLTWVPTASGDLTGNVTFTSDASNSSFAIPLTGTASGYPDIALNVASVAFGNVLVGSTSSSQLVYVRSTGTIPLTLNTVTGPATLVVTETLPITIPVGDSAAVHISWQPGAEGTMSSNVVWGSNSVPTPSLNLPCSGYGYTPAGVPNLSISYNLTLTKVVLTWDRPAGTITGYKIYRNATGYFHPLNVAPLLTGTLIQTITDPSILTYEDLGVTGRWYYRVVAYNDASSTSSIGSTTGSAKRLNEALLSPNTTLNSTTKVTPVAPVTTTTKSQFKK